MGSAASVPAFRVSPPRALAPKLLSPHNPCSIVSDSSKHCRFSPQNLPGCPLGRLAFVRPGLAVPSLRTCGHVICPCPRHPSRRTGTGGAWRGGRGSTRASHPPPLASRAVPSHHRRGGHPEEFLKDAPRRNWAQIAHPCRYEGQVTICIPQRPRWRRQGVHPQPPPFPFTIHQCCTGGCGHGDAGDPVWLQIRKCQYGRRLHLSALRQPARLPQLVFLTVFHW